MSARELDLTEAYYALIDRIWPMNIVGVLEFDGVIAVDRVAEAWARFTAAVPVVGARLEHTDGAGGRLVFGAATPNGVRTYADLEQAYGVESLDRIDAAKGPLVRCSVVHGDDHTQVLWTIHHSAFDGRSLNHLVGMFARVLLEDADLSGHPLTRPTLPIGPLLRPEHDLLSRRREMLDLARAVRDEPEYVGNAEPPPWHEAVLDRDRDPAMEIFDLTREETDALVGWARAAGATVHGALSAALLQTLEELHPGGRKGLATLVDLRVHADSPPDAMVGQAAAMVAGSYDAGTAPEELARTVSADVRRRVARSEGELFFALSGAHRLPLTDAAEDVVRRWTASASPTAVLSNLGQITDDLPAVFRGLTYGIALTPNQVLFSVVSTFQGRLHYSVGYDRSRLSIDPAALGVTFRERLVTMPKG